MGPVTLTELQELLASGRIHAETMIWREGSGRWVPASSMLTENLSVAPAAGPTPGHETVSEQVPANQALPNTVDMTSPPRPVKPEPGLPSVPGYEIQKVLGRGGMGVVYLARHLQLKRLVALKMILTGAHAGDQE